MPKTKVRPAGTGRIIPRGVDAITGSPKWLIRWYAGAHRDIDADTGKRIWRQKYASRIVYGTRKEAEGLLREELRASVPERRQVAIQRQSKLTVREFLTGWLEEGCPTDRNQLPGPRSCRTYREDISTYVFPALGDVLLPNLTVARVQRWVNDLAAGGRAFRTVEKAFASLRAPLFTAEARGLIERNPCRRDKGASRLKVKLPSKSARKVTPLGNEEAVKRLTTEAMADSWGGLWLVLLYGGLRPGEAGALRWDDLDGDTLLVRRVVEIRPQARTKGDPRQEPTRIIRETTKSGRDRAVTLPPFVAAYLRGPHRARQAEHRLKAGAAYDNQGFIFADELGRPVHATNLRYRFKALAKRAGLAGGGRVYDLRHTHATILAAAGVNPKVIAERLGHKDAAFTMRVYTGVLPSMQADAVQRLQQGYASEDTKAPVGVGSRSRPPNVC